MSDMGKPLRQTDRAFGLMFAAVLTTFGGLAGLIFGKILTWLFAAGAGFLVAALVAPGVLLPLNRLWGAFGHRLGRCNNFVLLGLFFYLFILPVGLLFRLFGRDPLQRRIEARDGSYWQSVTRGADKENYADMF